MKAKWFHLFSLVLVFAVAFSTVSPASAQPGLKFKGGGHVEESPNGVYIVQMINDPVVGYTGDVPGYPATKPEKGQKINPNHKNVVKYAGYLKGKHDEALKKAGGNKLYDYVYSFNGFAAQMSVEQANKLLSLDGVLIVNPDTLHTVDTSSTPSFLGLDAPGGLWEQVGGVGTAGEDIIIGVVDSGIWPESLSFTDRVDVNGIPSAQGTKVYQQIPGWHGKCTPGEQFPASKCNQKLIGAQRFNAAWGGDAGLKAERPWEFAAPRDYNGHGSHTASTAGGNNNVPTTGPAAAFGDISGIAPRARIAAYKALWSLEDGSQANGFNSDLVAAIDQAVADGVDVINYSVSGTQTNFLDPAQVSFLFAADAGIFVSTSAGNAGTDGSVAHPGPWLTTVAAGTHNRDGQGSVTLGNGATYSGASVATAVGPAPLVDSVNVGLASAPAGDVELCVPGSLDPALVSGKIVICKRGVIARVDKSRAVLLAGGVGMILYNNPNSSLNADFHFVPSVHVNAASGAAIKAYSAIAGATATINAATIVFNAPAPFTASFSSRGPLTAGGGDLLKPDVMAPGQDVLAAVAPPGNAGRDFNLYSGTSMSAPHVAGLSALLKNLHPDWSPMMIKSALMTTGYDVLDGGTPAPNTNPALIFRQGAGHVQPNSAADPGLVYDHGFNDWLAFLCGSTTGVNPASCAALAGLGYSFDPSNVNVASIAIGDMAGIQTVTRKVTNVGGSAATYTASISGLPGINAVVTPSSLSIGPGETKSFTITFTSTASASLNTYAGGQLTWTDGTHSVRSPIVIRPVALAAPQQVSGDGSPLTYNVTFGYSGAFTATPRGLVASVITADTVSDDPTDSTCSLTSPNAKLVPVSIPAGTTYARFSLFDADVTPGSDIDLCVFNSASALVGTSGSGTSAEEVNLTNPAAGNYTVVVQGWGVPGSSPFKLHTWLLGGASAGNMSVAAPATATVGGTGAINLTFSGLAPATKYLGSVVYGGAASSTAPTIVRIDTP
jgi:hypothetical protein